MQKRIRDWLHWQFEEQRRSIPAWFRESLATSALSDFRNTWLGGNTNGFFLTENCLWNKATGPVRHLKCLEMFRGKGSSQRSHIIKTRRNLTSFTLSVLVLEENLQNSVKLWILWFIDVLNGAGSNTRSFLAQRTKNIQ